MSPQGTRRVVIACSGSCDVETTALVESLTAFAATIGVSGPWLQVQSNFDVSLADALNARLDVCAVVFTAATPVKLKDVQPLCHRVAAARPDIFRVVFSSIASVNLVERYSCCSTYEANMVSDVPSHLQKSLAPLLLESGTGNRTCPVCGKRCLTDAELWAHAPQFHVGGKKNFTLRECPCPICGSNSNRELLLPHLFEDHTPPGVHHVAGRKFIPVVSFGLCVIQRHSDKKFLVVQEYDNQGYWLPGGGIDPGEFPVVAAQREALEEAGIAVELTGLLRVEYNCRSAGQLRMRYIFFGHPVDEAAPVKSFPDFESVGACWVDIQEVLQNHEIVWRSSEPLQWFSYVANGGPIYPIGLLAPEGAPPPTNSSSSER